MLARRVEPQAGSTTGAGRASAAPAPVENSSVLRSVARGTAAADADAFLRDAELASERLSAIVRLVIFLTLLALVITSGVDHHHEQFALITVAAYGVVAVAALVLAWRRIFHPALPYAYVTFDVALVCLSVLLISRMLDFPPHMAFAIPASAMIFVVLAHAAMRFRPALVAYAGTLTIVLMAFGMALMPAPEAAAPFSFGLEDADLLRSLLHSRILPFVIVALATLALWAISRRTYEMLQTSIEYSRRLGTLSRFFSPRLAERLAREAGPELSSGRRQRCAIMFIDIWKFTELAREMDPEHLSCLLAEFRSVVTDVIFEYGGMVDKFIGDAVLAVFGALQPAADDADRAIRCCLKVLLAVDAWSGVGKSAGGYPIRIGIGAHYGEVFVGAVGDERMLEFTVLGDAVNLAARLERLTRTVGSALVVSQAILEAAGPAQSYATWMPVPPSLIAGRLKGIEVFSLRTKPQEEQV
jgi:adenylate cyclase